MAETIGRAYIKILADGDGFGRSVDKEVRKADTDVHKSGEKTGEQYADGIDEGFGRRFKTSLTKMRSQWRDAWKNASKDADKFGGTLGKMFGKGSRNDFVNIFGSVIGKIGQMVSQFGSFFTQLGKGGGDIEATGSKLSSLGGAAGSVVGLVAGIGVALAAITAAAAPIAAGLSSIAAVLIALGGAALFALGALGGVAVMLGVTLGAALGVGILALTHLDDKTKEVAGNLKDEFGKLGDSAGKAIGPGLRQAMRIIEDTLGDKGLKRLVDNISTALGGVATRFAQITESAAFRKFLRSMNEFLPGAISQLGDAAANFTEGFLGIFRALTPVTDRFLGWLVRASQSFTDWANSAKGQNSLKDFFDKAADTASTVWDLIKNIGKAIGELAGAGQGSGNTLLQDMADQIGNLATWLGDPKNQKAVQDWFDQGVVFAEKFGAAIQSVIDLIDALDGPKSRASINFLLLSITALFNYWTDVVTVLSVVASGVVAAFKGMARGVMAVFHLIQRGWESVKDSFGRIDWGDSWSHFLDGPKQAIAGLRGFGGKVKNAIGKINLKSLFDAPTPGEIANKFRSLARLVLNAIGMVRLMNVFDIPSVSEIAKKFRSLASAVLGAIGKINLGSVIDIPSMSEIASKFSALGSMIRSAIGNIVPNINWPSPPGWLSKITASGGVFAGAQARIIGEAGPEAVVPLARPLSLVDPAVRELSAIAQGLRMPTTARGGTTATKTIDVGGIQIITPTKDPVAVAQETINRLVGVGY